MDMSDMFQVFRKEVEWAGRKLVLETGKIAVLVKTNKPGGNDDVDTALHLLTSAARGQD